MELKLKQAERRAFAERGLNRTSVELKPERRYHYFTVRVGLNRTSVELKPGFVGVGQFLPERVLIEPVWN